MGRRLKLTGQRFGRWLVLGKDSGRLWRCRCDCGTERSVASYALLGKQSTSCGCARQAAAQSKRLTGQRFGRFLVTADPADGKWVNDRKCRCRCDCGTVKDVFVRSLTRGLTLSCGCLNREIVSQLHTTHGLAGTPEYICWHAMIVRCRDPWVAGYQHYGGRGIRVCVRWQRFESFLEDMGPRPSLNHSLDRYPNQDGNYEPGNVRWATSIEQGRNRSNNVVVEFKGARRTISEWCTVLGLIEGTVRTRRRRGVTLAEKLFAPTGRNSASG